MNARGFSLIELLVVISLIAILLIVAALNFRSWSIKYAIEAQVKELHSDINSIRLRAMQTKQRHQITLNPSTITVRSFSNEADVVGTVLPQYSKTLKFQIQQLGGGGLTAFDNTPLAFNERGYLPNVGLTIAVGVSRGEAALNCLSVHTVRVNMGRINGNNCESQ